MIPLVDIKAQNATLKAELTAAFERVIDSGQVILGPEVEAFEQAFAERCGTRFAIGVNSGTSALHLALLAAGVRPGDEVVTTAMTFVATVAAILYAGATPVLVDIDPATRTLSADAVARAVGPRTRAIVPVHLHGGMADMDAIMAIADAHGLAVVEDAAQAHGARYKGRPAGSIGDLGCFSFYPGKNLGACGEAGAVVTDNEEAARVIRELRDWGQSARYLHTRHGYNYRMEALQGAFLAAKLPHLEGWTEARRANAAQYDRLLRPYGLAAPEPASDIRHVYHVYAIEVAERDRIRNGLNAAGVATGIHYPTPVHLQPAYAGLGYAAGDFPVAERFAQATLSLPMYPELTAAQVERIAGALRELTVPAMAR